MKIYVASTSLEGIRWATDNHLADGVVTHPTHLLQSSDQGPDPEAARQRLVEICQVTGLPVLASVTSINPVDIYREGRELAKISDMVQVQVPLMEDSVSAMARLQADGVRVVATLVYSPAQAVLAAKAGAFMVSIGVDQLDLYGHDGTEVVSDIAHLFAAHSTECDVLAALPQTAAQFARCARAGADVIAVTPEVMRALLVHPLTDRGFDQWLRELSRHHRTPAPA